MIKPLGDLHTGIEASKLKLESKEPLMRPWMSEISPIIAASPNVRSYRIVRSQSLS
jgi:hypothetical protein